MRTRTVHLIATACLAVALGASLAVADDDRPNVLLLVGDDLGYRDLGCYGGEIRTPHLDALAEHGVRFTQAYNSSRCCPSRASLLTGLYPHQARIGWFVGTPRKGLPGHQGRLTERCVTLAEVLKPAGYSVYACGKWHVNDPGPIARGFEDFYGFTHGYAVNSWEPGMAVVAMVEGLFRDRPPLRDLGSDRSCPAHGEGGSLRPLAGQAASWKPDLGGLSTGSNGSPRYSRGG